ncbi:MAG: hypothetical protein Q8P86_00640 [bacterium]|nr:hypothetical protein [bacterium]
MTEKIPQPNSLDSMEGLPRQDISLDFKEGNSEVVPIHIGKREVSTEETEPLGKAERLKGPEVPQKINITRLPPSFYREMIVMSYNKGDKETYGKFMEAVTAEEKKSIEEDAFNQSRKSFRQFSSTLLALDFTKRDLKELEDALYKSYEFWSEARKELEVIELITRSSRYQPFVSLLDKVSLLLTDLRLACSKEANRQESVWVRMFTKDRTNIIALSKILEEYREGLESLYKAISQGEEIDHALYAKLITKKWNREDFFYKPN